LLDDFATSIAAYCGYTVPTTSLKCWTNSPTREARKPKIYELARETLLQLDQTQLEVRAIVLRFEMQMLRLSGLMPSLRLCAGCGNAIDAQQWLIYGANFGGVLCSACSQGGRQLIRIPLEVRDFVEAFGNRDWRSVPVDHYIVRWRSTVRAMMAKTIAGLLEHRLKLHPYLEELGR
jgi:DNA repair protein RecO